MSKNFFGSLFLFLYLVPFSTNAAGDMVVAIPADQSDASIQLAPYPGSWETQRYSTNGINIGTGRDTSSVFFGAYHSNTGYQGTHRSFLSFDTSSIPDGAIVKNVKLMVYPSDVYNEFEDPYAYVVVVQGLQNSPTEVTTDDVERCGDGIDNPTLLSEKVDLSGLDTSSYFGFTLNNIALTKIDLQGYSMFCIREGHDVENIKIENNTNSWRATGIAHYSTESVGSDKDPYLEVTYMLPEEGTLGSLIERLIETVQESGVVPSVKQSYLAHVEKLLKLIENSDEKAQINQLEEFIKKVEHDAEKGSISGVFAQDVITQANTIIERIGDFEFSAPLLTQVVSPYPSIASTTAWASQVYAGGRASTTGDCGLTIEECGCALTSLSMLGRYYGVFEGYNGSSVDPGTMNDWLFAHDGYTKDGSILWTYALAYLGKDKEGKVVSPFGLGTLNATNTAVIKDFIRDAQPALLFNRSKGHWMLGRGTTKDGYYVNDPFWYETKTTGDTKDVANHIQGYNNIITKANLFEHYAEPKVLDESLEIVLESPAELLLVDGKGQRLGYDSLTDSVVGEIDGGTYDREDFIASSYANPIDAHKAKRLIVPRPESNVFELSVIGTGNGKYDLTTVASDGKGDLTKHEVTDTTSVGELHHYTVVLDESQNELPGYLQDILNLIPDRDQKKFIQAFRVVFAQTEKGHVAVTETLIENLVRYIESKYEEEVWAERVIVKLNEVLIQ